MTVTMWETEPLGTDASGKNILCLYRLQKTNHKKRHNTIETEKIASSVFPEDPLHISGEEGIKPLRYGKAVADGERDRTIGSP
jgi:hypothetical protein